MILGSDKIIHIYPNWLYMDEKISPISKLCATNPADINKKVDTHSDRTKTKNKLS
jgi:hypothetical protein